jgi:hypothetical protein
MPGWGSGSGSDGMGVVPVTGSVEATGEWT